MPMQLPLKALRALKDMTQEDVSEKLGVSRATYGKWEKYEWFPNAVQMRKLAELFNCKTDDIFFPEEPRN